MYIAKCKTSGSSVLLALVFGFLVSACQPGLLSGVGVDAQATSSGSASAGNSGVGAGGSGGVGPTHAGGTAGAGGITGEGGTLAQSTFVMVGAEGQIATTVDGETIVEVQPKSGMARDDLRSVAFLGSQFIAVGGTAGVGVVRRSADGEQWLTLGVDPGAWIGDVARHVGGADLLVAVGENGGRWYSTDWGTTLTASSTAPPAGHFFRVATNDLLSVAVGESAGEGMTSVSSDGQTWSDAAVAGAPLHAVVYGAGVFVAVGSSGRCSVSTDGVSWTDFALSSDDYQHLAYVNSEFVIPGTQGEFRSTDGYTWAFVSPTPRRVFAYGAGIHIGVAEDGRVYRSADGMVWTQASGTAPAAGLTFGKPDLP